MSLQLAPAGSARAQQLLEDPRTMEGLGTLTEGRFKKQRGGQLVTYAEKVDEHGVMHNVFIVERDDLSTNPLTVTHAQRGENRLT